MQVSDRKWRESNKGRRTGVYSISLMKMLVDASFVERKEGVKKVGASLGKRFENWGVNSPDRSSEVRKAGKGRLT